MVNNNAAMKKLNVCFVGLGSIGTRHLNNLIKYTSYKKINVDIHAIRNTGKSLNDNVKCHVSKEMKSVEDIDDHYDVIFVTNPTSMHYDSIRELLPFCSNMFIEKPIFENSNYDLGSIDFAPDKIYYVAAPIRYTDTFRHLKEYIKDKVIVSVRIICSSYMPDWQKGRDYTKSFRVEEKMGGGVDIDLVHEIDYMKDLFGMPRDVVRVAGHYSDLKMNACDLAVYIFSYDDFVVEMHLDYFGRVDKREIELYLNDEVLVGDFLRKEVKYLSEGKTVSFDKTVDHYYREMATFLDMIIGKESDMNINSVNNAFDILKLAKGEM